MNFRKILNITRFTFALGLTVLLFSCEKDSSKTDYLEPVLVEKTVFKHQLTSDIISDIESELFYPQFQNPFNFASTRIDSVLLAHPISQNTTMPELQMQMHNFYANQYNIEPNELQSLSTEFYNVQGFVAEDSIEIDLFDSLELNDIISNVQNELLFTYFDFVSNPNLTTEDIINFTTVFERRVFTSNLPQEEKDMLLVIFDVVPFLLQSNEQSLHGIQNINFKKSYFKTGGGNASELGCANAVIGGLVMGSFGGPWGAALGLGFGLVAAYDMGCMD